MGTKSFATFQAELLVELGNRTDLTSYKDDWINAAYIDFCTRKEFWGLRFPKNFTFPELDVVGSSINTVDGTAYIAAPTDTVFIYSLWDSTSDRKLTRMASIREYVERHSALPAIEIEVPPLSDPLEPALRSRLQALIETAKARRRS